MITTISHKGINGNSLCLYDHKIPKAFPGWGGNFVGQREPQNQLLCTNGLLKGKGPKRCQKINMSSIITSFLLFSRDKLAFLNLRGLLTTLLKALHLCSFAMLNNKRIVFVGDTQPVIEEYQSHLFRSFIGSQATVFATRISSIVSGRSSLESPRNTSAKATTMALTIERMPSSIEAKLKSASFSSPQDSEQSLNSWDHKAKADGQEAKSGPLSPSLSSTPPCKDTRGPISFSKMWLNSHGSRSRKGSTLSQVQSPRTVDFNKICRWLVLESIANCEVSPSSDTVLTKSPLAKRSLRQLIMSEINQLYKQPQTILSTESINQPDRSLPGPVGTGLSGKGSRTRKELSEKTLTKRSLNASKSAPAARPSMAASRSDSDSSDRGISSTNIIERFTSFRGVARFVSKSAIRSSQWTATLAQPTNHWVGGFFSNSYATYRQSMSDATQLLLSLGIDYPWPHKMLSEDTTRGALPPAQGARLGVLSGTRIDRETPRVGLPALFFFLINGLERLCRNRIVDLSGLLRLQSLPYPFMDNSAHTTLNSYDSAIWSKLESHQKRFNKWVAEVKVRGLRSTTGVDGCLLADDQLKSRVKLLIEWISRQTTKATSKLTVARQGAQEMRLPKLEAKVAEEGLVYDFIQITGFDTLETAKSLAVPRKRLRALDIEVDGQRPERKPKMPSFIGLPMNGPLRHQNSLRFFKKGRRFHEKVIKGSLAGTDVGTTNPWLKEADFVFFANPERSLQLLSQINRLQIPTIGIVTSGSHLASPFRGNKTSASLANKPIINFPIIGNTNSVYFLRMVLTKIACVLGKKRT